MASTELKRPGEISAAVPVISLESLEKLSETSLAQLERLLPGFIATRRWYRSKTKTIRRAAIQDLVSIPEIHSVVAVVALEYEDEGSDKYVIAIRFGDNIEGQIPPVDSELLATYRTGDGREGPVMEALSDEQFRSWLLRAIAGNETVKGRRGEWSATRTGAFQIDAGAANLDLPSSVSRAEQSNTSIIYGEHYILKLFRKIEAGTNPDVEVGAFLTEHGFRNTPAVLGAIEYRPGAGMEPYSAGILQEFVRNQGDAWKYTLESLGGFFNHVLSSKVNPPTLSSQHPLDVATALVPADAQSMLGTYVDSARLLGRRTAEMHTTLADPDGGPQFAPEPFAATDAEELYREMLKQSEMTFGLLRQKAVSLPEPAATDAKRLLERESVVAERFSSLRTHETRAHRIRFHGDYHLGQVLYTGTDFLIIDFEGEPARPLSERRSKGLALRDVAGMIRSFQYAAYAALFGQVPGLTVQPEAIATIEGWAGFWFTSVGATYLDGYFAAAEGKGFLSPDAAERRVVLDAFLLHKALYEVAYELNNRPDWVRIPLRGILGLID